MPFAEFALSLGLPSTPRVRFLSGGKKGTGKGEKGGKGGEEGGEEEEEEGELEEEEKEEGNKTRGGNEGVEEEEDFLMVKRVDHGLEDGVRKLEEISFSPVEAMG